MDIDFERGEKSPPSLELRLKIGDILQDLLDEEANPEDEVPMNPWESLCAGRSSGRHHFHFPRLVVDVFASMKDWEKTELANMERGLPRASKGPTHR